MLTLHAQELTLPFGGGALEAQCCLQYPRLAGSPAALQHTAGVLAATAQALRDALGELRRLRSDGSLQWLGSAGDSFRAALDDPPHIHLDDVPARYDGYARALSRYAAELDSAQLRVAQARVIVQDTLDRYRTLTASGQPSELAATVCGNAARVFRDAVNDWVAQLNLCLERLYAADGDSLHNPHGWQVFVDDLSTWAGDISTVAMVVGLLTLPFCPALSGLAFTISFAASGLQLGADLTRKYVLGEPVGLMSLAFDALGAIPYAGATTALGESVDVLKAGGSHIEAIDAGVRTFAHDYRAETVTVAVDSVERLKAGEWVATPDLVSTVHGYLGKWQDIGSLGITVGNYVGVPWRRLGGQVIGIYPAAPPPCVRPQK